MATPLPLADATFAEMLAEWTALQNQAADIVAGWEEQLATILAEEERLRTAGRWIHGRADFMGVLGLHRDEVRHSRMIKWLLDPCGRHGLGAEFLQGVLDAASIDGSRDLLGRARTTCEVVLASGRVDIVVEAGDLYLVIENKVDAQEGLDQCAYYYDHTIRSHPTASFILLSPDGRDPRSTRADVKTAFRPLSYTKLRIALQSALKRGDSGADARHVAEDYLRTLDEEFP